MLTYLNTTATTESFPAPWKPAEDSITVNGKKTRVLAERYPGKIPWKDYGVEVVIESTGLFTDPAKAQPTSMVE